MLALVTSNGQVNKHEAIVTGQRVMLEIEPVWAQQPDQLTEEGWEVSQRQDDFFIGVCGHVEDPLANGFRDVVACCTSGEKAI